MARGDALHARIDVEFILSDPRLFTLSPYTQTVYMGLWCLAVKERKEILPPWYTATSLSETLHKDARSMDTAITSLQQACLVSMTEENCIHVVGVASKHPRMKGWVKAEDSPYGDTTLPVPSHKGATVPEDLVGLELYEQDRTLCDNWDSLRSGWIQTYPNVQIVTEMRKAHMWEMANKKNRKKDRPRFLNSWFARQQSQSEETRKRRGNTGTKTNYNEALGL